MYLSSLFLNLRKGAVRRDLADCHALHRSVMSGFPDLGGRQTSDARARLGVLFRLEPPAPDGRLMVLVQSLTRPTWEPLLAGGYLLALGSGTPKDVAAAYAAIQTDDELLFRLRANPTRKVDTRSGPNGERRNGRRVPLVTEGDQLRWLARKGDQGGFRLQTARARQGLSDARPGYLPPEVPAADPRPAGRLLGWHDGLLGSRQVNGSRLAPSLTSEGAARRERLTFGDVLFEGRLVVTDADQFRQTLESGIGPGKAYGFGLLSVARPAP